jgi:hypothetical protein
MVSIPENLPLLIGTVPDYQAAVVERILKGQIDLRTNLIDLGKFWKVKIWFDQKMDICVLPHWHINADNNSKTYITRVHTNEHIFNCITTAQGTGMLLYGTSRKARRGYYFPDLSTVTKYEPVIDSPQIRNRTRTFEDYEQFKAKFDPFFITETEILRLWNGTSSQHGGKYMPADFHKIGPRGKHVLERFLKSFKGITSTDYAGYRVTENKGVMTQAYLVESYNSCHHLGRDIKIEHRAGNDFVWYSSEYSGCGNGRYGLIANRNEFLWLEDD